MAVRFGVRAPGKAETIRGLAALLTERFPPSQDRLAPTLAAVTQYLQSLQGSRRGLRSEADAECFLASALGDRFERVQTQVQVPGHIGHRIDIDIADGGFGVEVKFAPAVVESSSEAYRLLGQAFYYDRRRYAGRLLAVLVGPPELAGNAITAEVVDLLGAMGVPGLYLGVS